MPRRMLVLSGHLRTFVQRTTGGAGRNLRAADTVQNPCPKRTYGLLKQKFMKRITNPWSGMEGYRCFGCDPHSERGLRMEFYEDGDEIVSVWHPRPEFQGWVDTLHGGIQATLADEISSWVVFRKFQTSGVTSKMEVRYLHPIHTSDERITLRASVRQQRRNLVEIGVRIFDVHDRLCT